MLPARPHTRRAAPDVTSQGRPVVLAWGIVLSFAGLVIALIVVDILRRSNRSFSWTHALDGPSLAGFAVALGGLAAFGYGVYIRWMQRLIENTPTSPVRSLPSGFVEVAGTAEADGAPLVSPAAQVPCVYYEFRLEEYRGGQSSRRWVTVASDRSTEPFFVRDSTGRVLVVPMGATARIRRVETLSQSWQDALPDETRRLFRYLDMPTASWLGPRRVRFQERLIGVGDPVYVLGTARENPAGCPNAADSSRLYIGASEGGRPFLIVDHSEHALLSRLRWISRTCLYGGPLATAFGIWWWFTRSAGSG